MKVHCMEITYIENNLAVQDFNMLRNSVGMLTKPCFQAEKALKNGLFSIVAYHGDNVVGMGRLVGDGSMYWYVQDVVVLPEYQGLGIGKEIMRRLKDFVLINTEPDTITTIGLMAAKGKEEFYKKLGFRSRPNDKEDPGMIMIIEKKFEQHKHNIR